MNNTIIAAYLDSKKNSWSPATLKSEEARLHTISPLMTSPEALYTALSAAYAPYSVVTYWTRAVALYDFYLRSCDLEIRSNPFADYRKDNARLFKNKYQPRHVEVTFEQAKNFIETIKDPDTYEACARALFGGLRIHEVHAIQGSLVTGKGGKSRNYFGPAVSRMLPRTIGDKVRKALAPINLTPHDLRRLFATKIVQEGMKEADLLKVMGWNSILTAKSYLQPKANSELANIIGGIRS